eukprot:g726.t1
MRSVKAFGRLRIVMGRRTLNQNRSDLFGRCDFDSSKRRSIVLGSSVRREASTMNAPKDGTIITGKKRTAEENNNTCAGSTTQNTNTDDIDEFVEWERRVDAKTGREFYFHPDTKQASWQHPSVGLRPANAWRRYAAGTIDAMTAFGFGAFLSGMFYVELESMFVAQLGMALGVMTGFTFRDSVFEHGTRSLGKRIMSIEIVCRRDGMLPTRMRTLSRNIYVPIFELNGPLFPFVHLLFLSDLLLIRLDRQRRRYGDFIAGTMVVPEMPLVRDRVVEQKEQQRLAQLKEETGTKWAWKKGRLRMFDEETDDPGVQNFQPDALYSFNSKFPFRKKDPKTDKY